MLAALHDDGDVRAERFAYCDSSQCCFDSTNLDGATFEYVDLTGASFRGASLIGTTFRHVRANGACFAGIQGRDARWERSTLSGADFASAAVKRAKFTGCDLQSASFDGADLTLAWLVDSTCDGMSLQQAVLRHTETFRSSFDGANLATAKDFAYCRELVIEILRRTTERELEIAKMIGALTELRLWCYPAWSQVLAKDPTAFGIAVRTFSSYPTSGCLEALVEALKS